MHIHIYIYIYICMYIYIYICIYIHMYMHLSIYPSIYLTIYLSIYLSIYLWWDPARAGPGQRAPRGGHPAGAASDRRAPFFCLRLMSLVPLQLAGTKQTSSFSAKSKQALRKWVSCESHIIYHVLFTHGVTQHPSLYLIRGYICGTSVLAPLCRPRHIYIYIYIDR